MCDPAGVGRATLSEINLRMGGTTHPYLDGPSRHRRHLRPGVGRATGAGEAGVRCYVATNNIKSLRPPSSQPADVIARVDEAGLAFDPATGCGVTLHLLGVLPGAARWAWSAWRRRPRRPTTCTSGSGRRSNSLTGPYPGVSDLRVAT